MSNNVGNAIFKIMNAEIYYVRDFWFLADFFTVDAGLCINCSEGLLTLEDIKHTGWVGPQYSGVDIETEGVLNPHLGAVATVQIELNGNCWVVHIEQGDLLREVAGVELFWAYLQNRQVTKVIHNAAFELKFFLYEYGTHLECEPIHDTMAGEYLLAEGMNPDDDETSTDDKKAAKQFGVLGLGPTVKRRYGIEMDKDKALRSGFRRRGTVQVVPPPIAGGHPMCCVPECDGFADAFKGSAKNAKPVCMHHFNHSIVSRYKAMEAVDSEAYYEKVVDHATLTQRQLEYAAFDALWVAVLAEDQIDIMTEREIAEGEQYFSIFELDCKATEAIARMELAGMPVNEDDLYYLDAEFQWELTKLLESIQSAVYMPGDKDLMNIGSWQQMLPRLNLMGIPIGSYQSAELKRFKHIPLIEDILNYKRLVKLQGTYTGSFVEKRIASTGAIHCSFNQFVTSTGRLSCSGPNLQNLPSRSALGLKIRELVQAPAGYTFVIADYSQIELRLIAEMYNDAAMIKAFNDGKDLHSLMAAQIMGVTYEEIEAGKKGIYASARTNAKVCNFGLGYGAGAAKLQIMAWVQYELDWDMAETKRNKSAFDNTWQGVKAHHNRVSAEIKMGSGPYRVRTQDGRVRCMPRVWQNAQGQTRTCFSAAMNQPIQGSSADMIKKVMVELCRKLTFILQVHDELVVLCKIEDSIPVMALLQSTMERIGQTYLPRLPIGVDAKISNVWSK